MYYPNLLKQYHIITDEVINKIYHEYAETINIMVTYKKNHVRSKLHSSASLRAKENDLPFDIISEDIKLVCECPLLNVPIEYGNSVTSRYSASLDKNRPK